MTIGINHYVFDKVPAFREKILGRDMCDNIIINSMIPLLYTYGKMIPDFGGFKKGCELAGTDAGRTK